MQVQVASKYCVSSFFGKCCHRERACRRDMQWAGLSLLTVVLIGGTHVAADSLHTANQVPALAVLNLPLFLL